MMYSEEECEICKGKGIDKDSRIGICPKCKAMSSYEKDSMCIMCNVKLVRYTDCICNGTGKKRLFEYGWENGNLVMERNKLTKKEEGLLQEIQEIAFREMGERTRIASGDDQVYVEGLYNQLKKDKNSQILVRVVFRLCKQANTKNPTKTEKQNVKN